MNIQNFKIHTPPRTTQTEDYLDKGETMGPKDLRLRFHPDSQCLMSSSVTLTTILFGTDPGRGKKESG